MGIGAFNMPGCIWLLPLRHCEAPKSKLTHTARAPLALASVGMPIFVAMWVHCALRPRAPVRFDFACRDRPEGTVPLYPPPVPGELFDTALENCWAQT